MAIDTKTKRASIVSVAAVWMGASVVPSGSFTQDQRQVVAWSYSGILAGGGGPMPGGGERTMLSVTSVWDITTTERGAS